MLAQILASTRYTLGTACALAGVGSVWIYYWLVRKNLGRKTRIQLRLPSFQKTDSRYWTQRPYVLAGVALSILFLSLSGAAEGQTFGSDWPTVLFLVLLAAVAFALLVVGFVFLGRLWKEFFLLVGGRDLADPENDPLAPLGFPLLKHAAWGFAGLALLAASLEKMGYRIPVINGFVGIIYEHVLWIALIAILILLWTSKNPAVLLLGFALLLVFTATILGTLGFGLWTTITATSPVFVLLLAGIVVLNFAFFYSIEDRARIKSDRQSP